MKRHVCWVQYGTITEEHYLQIARGLLLLFVADGRLLGLRHRALTSSEHAARAYATRSTSAPRWRRPVWAPQWGAGKRGWATWPVLAKWTARVRHFVCVIRIHVALNMPKHDRAPSLAIDTPTQSLSAGPKRRIQDLPCR